MTPLTPIKVRLVDPSLFTAPYDAALSEGLIECGVVPRWATRPQRLGDRAELPPEIVDAFFYRRTDGLRSMPRPVRALLKGCSHILGLIELVRSVAKSRPDIVHFQWTVLPPLDALAIWFIRRYCPVVLTVHDTVPFNGETLSRMQNMAFFLPMKLADSVIVHTRAGRVTLMQAGLAADKIHVIAHGPLKLSEPIPNIPHDTRWTFVLFGEIKPYKGLDLVVEALALLPKSQRANLRIIVAGRPRMDMQPILQRVTHLGLDECFEFHPKRLSETEMATLFARADCFLLPYRQIDASGVYYLIKSLGAWLIASRVGIFAEDIREDIDGQLCTAGDIGALAAAMTYAVQFRPHGGKRDAGQHWAAIARQTRQCYESASAAHSGRADTISPTNLKSHEGRPS